MLIHKTFFLLSCFCSLDIIFVGLCGGGTSVEGGALSESVLFWFLVCLRCSQFMAENPAGKKLLVNAKP